MAPKSHVKRKSVCNYYKQHFEYHRKCSEGFVKTFTGRFTKPPQLLTSAKSTMETPEHCVEFF